MHTSGPWTLNDEGNSIVVSGGPNNDDIADFSYREEHTVSITREEALANARLFIAAPMMLDLLEKYYSASLRLYGNMVKQVLTDAKAIKAEHFAQFQPLENDLRAIRVILDQTS